LRVTPFPVFSFFLRLTTFAGGGLMPRVYFNAFQVLDEANLASEDHQHDSIKRVRRFPALE
jgi:hypothetical protein